MVASLLSAVPAQGVSDVESYVGQWALHRERGAGWLELRLDEGKLAGSLLYGGGSVVPLNEVVAEDDRVVLVRKRRVVNKKTKKAKIVVNRWEVRLKDGQLAGKVGGGRRDGAGHVGRPDRRSASRSPKRIAFSAVNM